MKKSILLIVVGVLLVALGGAIFFLASNQVYKYKDTEIDDDFSIEKSVYKKSTVEVYCDVDYSYKTEEVIFYDQNFEEIKDGVRYSWEDDCLIIKGKNASKVSGMKVDFGHYVYYQVRYLNTPQFAALTYNWADDYGYIEEGDREAYYTEEELAEQAAKKAAREAERKSNLEKAYSFIEGNWKNADGSQEKHFIRDGEDFMYEKCEEYIGADYEGLDCNKVLLLDVKVYEEDGVQYVELYYHEGVYDWAESIEIISETEINLQDEEQIYTKY